MRLKIKCDSDPRTFLLKPRIKRLPTGLLASSILQVYPRQIRKFPLHLKAIPSCLAPMITFYPCCLKAMTGHFATISTLQFLGDVLSLINPAAFALQVSGKTFHLLLPCPVFGEVLNA
jgi:hypothetical protein